MRLFVGIELPSAIADHLSLVGGGIPRARWEGRDKLHITLRFIGDVDGGTARAVEQALTEVEHPPFPLAVAGVGHFPPSGEPRILWAGLDDPAPLHTLHARVDRILQHEGLDGEARNYAPHVTLARLKQAPRSRVVEFLQHNALLRTAPFVVGAFQLYSSVLSPRGSKYRIERDYPLRG
ncbi:MAG: RNA 2',3'-cyclic phosphodiesterase [Deltaproteobacteria bacterium]|nr:RNA 2',3'-cyclic phosphodiesterase [Deltaproteobacteria bacterium]